MYLIISLILTFNERPIDHPAEDGRQAVEQATKVRIPQIELLPRGRFSRGANSKPSRGQKASATSL